MTERFKGRAQVVGPIKYTGRVPWLAQPLLVDGPIADITTTPNGGLCIEIAGTDGKRYEIALDAETCRAIAIITPKAES